MEIIKLFSVNICMPEKAVNAHNYRFFWKGPCFNYLISTLRLGFNAGLFEGNLF